ncbi:MAG TPA: hypothetical protein VMG99_09075 [Thermoplasmata archaeon]|nr:hypothetical protein [Thermoplasmata archaeon]
MPGTTEELYAKFKAELDKIHGEFIAKIQELEAEHAKFRSAVVDARAALADLEHALGRLKTAIGRSNGDPPAPPAAP